jgi:hypothetical protein
MQLKTSLSLLSLVLLTACGGGGGGGAAGTGSTMVQAADATSISDYSSVDITSKLTTIGTYDPNIYQSMNGNNTALIDMYGVGRFGTDQAEGIVLTGWAWNKDAANNPDVYQVNMAILAQKSDGTLRVATSEMVPSPLTNGAGSVVIGDFNGDGKDDIFLAAYNESPMKAKSSVAYISNRNGAFDKVGLVAQWGVPMLASGTDAVLAHDGKLVKYQGKNAIMISSYNTAGRGFVGVYTYNGLNFDFTRLTVNGIDLEGSSAALGDFLGNGKSDIVVADAGWDLGKQWDASMTAMRGLIYSGNNTSAFSAPATELPAPFFNNKPEYNSFTSFWDSSNNKTHQSRVWTDDVNQDGKDDMIIGSEIWPGWKAMLQILINNGSGSFVDKTAGNMPFNENTGYDYDMRLVDLDNSGIKTYLMAQTDAYCKTAGCRNRSLHGNYIMVNDGTGQFHLAMHDEFQNMGTQVLTYMRSQMLSTPVAPITWRVENQESPKFIAYRNSSGKLNFLAKATVPDNLGGPVTMLVNVPVAIDLRTQFKKDITISNRNGSKNIRTFAGNDTIASGCASTCKVDGGLGTNTVVYSGPKSQYSISGNASSATVSHSGVDGTDQLKNIKYLRFTDQTVTLQ